MSAKKYRVRLTAEERTGLKALVSKGRTAAYKQTHARILLQCDEGREDGGRTDGEIADALETGMATVARVRRRCVEEGIETALNRRPQVNRRPKVLDGDAEARLVAMACGEPPEGCAKWTLRLLADRLVECEIVEAVSAETVRGTLKKRSQAVAEGVLVHPAEGECGVRVRDGGRTGAPHMERELARATRRFTDYLLRVGAIAAAAPRLKQWPMGPTADVHCRPRVRGFAGNVLGRWQ